MIDIPSHIALIPDGNRRWAKEHGVPVLEGHQRGARTTHQIVEYLISCRIKFLTVWSFSSDNWKRSEGEIEDLFNLLALWIETDAPWLNEQGVRLCHLGRLRLIPETLQNAINQAVRLTSENGGMTLNLAFNYTGRAEIVDAVRRLIDQGVTSQLLDESLFSHYLYTDGTPDVDLVIRTAGEVRLSNFLLWQTAYSEFYFTPVLWPDFTVEELEKALKEYNERQRRFGGD